MKSVGSFLLSALLALGGIQFASGSGVRDTDSAEQPARLATFDSTTGQIHFALSVTPQIAEVDARPTDVLILVDTSASQAGLYLSDATRVAEQMLQGLSREDRVQIAAVDLEIVAQPGSSFVAPDAPAALSALEQVRNRVPLGSTDLSGMMEAIPGLFSAREAGRNCSVVYIGDGVGRAGLVNDANFMTLVNGLASRQISFSCYAIGPERDIETMAAVVNMTGGNLFLDSDDANAVANGARSLVQTVQGPVFWPVRLELPSEITEIYPRQLPPLRADRDSIVVGTLASRESWTLQATGLINGVETTMSWPVAAESSSEDFSFLPKLVDFARAGSGMNLPLLGSAGLRETARMLAEGSQTLTRLGTQALVMGNVSAAKVLATEALERDGSNTEAELLLGAANQGVTLPLDFQEPAAPSEDPANSQQDPVQGPVVAGQEQPQVTGGEQGSLQLIGPTAGQDDEASRLIRESAAKSGELYRDEEEMIRVRTGRIRSEVQVELTRATQELRTDPASAVNRLKSMLDVLDQTMDIETSARADLRNRIESALGGARREKLAFDSRMAEKQRRDAAVQETLANLQALETREEEISRHLNRFNDLLREGNYLAAEEKTLLANQLAPELPETNAAHESAKLADGYYAQMELRRIREMNFLAALYESEFSTLPRSGNPPLVFPDREFWNEIKAKRQKYQSVRLSGNEIDEAILNSLDRTVEDFVYDEVPFSDVIADLRTNYKINIVLDESAVLDSLQEDTSVSANVSGIRLKNALRLMLAKHNATFIVRDQVLRIISKDSEDDPEFFVTNIFNVGDLVAPRANFGGMMGGMMGGMGGGMGGMGGGMGGMGGGMGGMGGGMGGMGGGGMGGAFCLQDVAPSVAGSAAPATSATRPTADGNKWNQQFASGTVDPALVVGLVKDLMESRQTGEAASLIEAAMRHGQSQPWMYEALALAMQIEGRSRMDIERAVMSAVDFSNDPADSMIAARYLSENGMEKRALDLLMDVSAQHEAIPEPYVIGLQAATRIKDMAGLRWATRGILSRAWPQRPEVFDDALLAAEDLITQMTKSGMEEEVAAYREEIEDALKRDVIIEVAWTGDADLDLLVEEPGGSICSRHVPRTVAGGVLMGDGFTAGEGQTREYYVLPRGFSGEYRAVVRRVSGKTTGDRATVTVHGHYNSDKATSDTRQVTVTEKGSLLVFSLENGRRQQSIEASRLSVAANEQFAVNRAVTASQLDSRMPGSALSEYLVNRNGNAQANNGEPAAFRQEDNPGGLLRPGQPGYQPVISQFFTGAGNQVNHATTSDRLYVMISSNPFFSQIESVTTFNIAGGANNATGTGGAGGLGGIGGGGGGGGIGGGGIGGGGGF